MEKRFDKADLLSAPIDGKCITLWDCFDYVSNCVTDRKDAHCIALFSHDDCVYALLADHSVRDIYGNPTIADYYTISNAVKEETDEDWADYIAERFEDGSVKFLGKCEGCVIFSLYEEYYRNTNNKGMWRAISLTDDADAEVRALQKIEKVLTENNNDELDYNYIYCDCDIVKASDGHHNLEFGYYYHKSRI